MSVAQYARLKESQGPGNNFGFIQGTQGIITLKELRESGNNIGHLYFRMETRHLSALEHVYYHWNLTLIWNLDKRSVKLRDDFKDVFSIAFAKLVVHCWMVPFVGPYFITLLHLNHMGQ